MTIVTLAKSFGFEAAHTLDRSICAEGSRRIHGHSYRAEIVLRGAVDPKTGMLADLGRVEKAIEPVRDALDHRLLDEIDGLGPATIENLSRWIYHRLKHDLPGLVRVVVHRDSLKEWCAYDGPEL